MLVVVVLVVLFVFAVPARYAQIVTFSHHPMEVEPDAFRLGLDDSGISVAVYARWWVGMEVAFAAVCVALGLMIFRRRSEHGMAMFLSLLLVLLGTTFWNTLSALSRYHPVWTEVGTGLAELRVAALFLLFYIFPDGRFVPGWTRWLATVLFLGLVGEVLFPIPVLAVESWPVPLFMLFMLFWLLTGVLAQIYRYRHVSGPAERQQAMWVVLGSAAAVIGLLGVILVGEVLFSGASGSPAELLGAALINLFMLLVPASVTVAILRHRLFDIDVLINRALVYGTLTALVVGLYVFVVGGVGTALRIRDEPIISLLAAGLVAVLFAPLRERLQRGVNHVMYGERDEPYTVITRLGEHLEGTIAPQAALESIVDTVTGALKLPYAAITLKEGEQFRTVAERGAAPAIPTVVPLTYQRETVGQLVLATRSDGDSFSSAEQRLLADVARPAGMVAHAVRLTADLQRSRERLVNTREEERRRLRRDLHDGIGPQLAALTLRLDTAGSRLGPESETGALLADLSRQVRSVVADIRRSVYGLRPPALDELGLLSALQQTVAQYGQSGPDISVQAPTNLPTLPAAAEVAAYRIAQEAITNVARHADARSAQVRLQLDADAQVLLVEIVDDGRGVGDSPVGVGLRSMRERAEELGGTVSVAAPAQGGTRVLAQLPCRTLDPADAVPG